MSKDYPVWFEASDNFIGLDDNFKTANKKLKEVFTIKCNNCKSTDIQLIRFEDVGFAESGMWGDAKVILKCKKCGSAVTIVAFDTL